MKLYLDDMYLCSLDISKFNDTWDLCVHIKDIITEQTDIKFFTMFINNRLAYPDNLYMFYIKSIKRIDIKKMLPYYAKSGKQMSDIDAYLKMTIYKHHKSQSCHK